MVVKNLPACMTVAGSDSGGGAGIQADLKAFAYFKTHGTAALTAVTAQNPHEVSAIAPIPVEVVIEQYRAIMSGIKISAIKTGMLFSADVVEALAIEMTQSADQIPLVVDPVMVATSGAVLLQEDAIAAMKMQLIPLATVITPNLPEAELLLGEAMERTEDQAIQVAERLSKEFDVAVLIKGGHFDTGKSIDYLAAADHIYRIATPEVEALTTHGTGCMLSSAIAANLALGKDPHSAIVAAKAYVYHCLSDCRRIGQKAYGMVSPKYCDESIVGVAMLR